jgi:hypothetical protein
MMRIVRFWVPRVWERERYALEPIADADARVCRQLDAWLAAHPTAELESVQVAYNEDGSGFRTEAHVGLIAVVRGDVA